MFFIEYTYTCFIANFYTHAYTKERVREKESERASELTHIVDFSE